MSRVIVLILCLLSLFLGGCNESQKGTTPNGETKSFPAAGIWKADRRPFVIKLTEDAELEWAIVDPGSVKVYPHKRVEFPMQDDSIGYFEVGDCPVAFNPKSSELSVEINVTKLMIPFPDDKLEGHVQHTFTGFLSEDGKTWNTDFYEVFDYGPRFPMATEDEFMGIPVKFTRMEETVQ